jgi:hypothetical protein
MLNGPRLRHALDLSERAYELLMYLVDAAAEGFVDVDSEHRVEGFAAGAEAWIREHWARLPHRMRPARHDIGAFAAYFATYLESSFALAEQSEQRLYEANGCSCAFCSWLVDAAEIETRQPTTADKRRARELTREVVAETLRELGGRHYDKVEGLDDAVRDALIDRVAADSQLREERALVAYAHQLLRRTRGQVVGPATLVLWRIFAWTHDGRPRDEVVLSAERFFEAEDLLRARLERELSQVD